MGWLDGFQSLIDEKLSGKGPVSQASGKDLSPSVTSAKLHAPTKEEIIKADAEKQALTGPTIGPISIDPTDYLGPGSFAKTLKGLFGIGIVVGHASPYKFSTFSLDKLKTGQGVNSYGSGIYLAEHPRVLELYEKEMLAKKQSLLSGFDSQIAAYTNLYKNKKLSVEDRQIAFDNLTRLKQEKVLASSNISPTSYSVDLPDEYVRKMIDWDAPVAVSTPVKEELAKISSVTESSFNSGNRLYKDIADSVGFRGAAEILQNQGIAGIRYVDQRSRSVGASTNNFVVFDPSILTILNSTPIK